MKRTRSGGKKKHARTRTNVVIYEGGREKCGECRNMYSVYYELLVRGLNAN